MMYAGRLGPHHFVEVNILSPLLMIDDRARHAWIYILKHKSEVLQSFESPGREDMWGKGQGYSV